MAATLPTDVLVVDVIEAKARKLMAYRAALPRTWQYRQARVEIGAELDGLLERYNWLTLRR